VADGDFRDHLAGELDARGVKDATALVAAVFDAMKDVYVTCRHCGKKTDAPVPDVVSRAKALDILLNQAKGKPAQTVRHEHSGVVGLRPVSEMSLGEIDAELAGLPPAAA
jgi:hypothetical protein